MLFPIQPRYLVQECKADNGIAPCLMGKESPQSVGVSYSPGGELRGWIMAPEGIPCMEQHVRLRNQLISCAGNCRMGWEAAADGVGVPGAV